MRFDRERTIVLLWAVLAGVVVCAAAWWMHRTHVPAAPQVLWALLLLPAIAVVHIIRLHRRQVQVVLPTAPVMARGPRGFLTRLRHLPFTLSLAGCGLLLLALARPQSREHWRDVEREGIDIMIALDVSGSMLARDLRPDRLEASKRVAMEFIDGRPDDRIGLVVYEGTSFSQCPLTTDHRVLKELFMGVRSGLLDGGTAIGMGLATALNRLRDSEAKSKVVILLTDGVNNAGLVQPMDAAQIAQALGVRVYTIGVGTRGKALSPVALYPNGQYKYDYVDVEIDEALLQEMATMTGGRYFRATDEAKLRAIYREIDELERTRIHVTEHSQRNEEYLPYLASGLGLLVFAFLLDRSVLRTMA